MAVTHPQHLVSAWTSSQLQGLEMHPPRAIICLEKRTQEHLENWRLLTSDQGILEAVTGYKLDFTGSPKQSHVPLSEVNARETKLANQEIQKLLDKGAIQQVSEASPRGYYSRFFLVPKKGGQYRPAINLHPINSFLILLLLDRQLKADASRGYYPKDLTKTTSYNSTN